MSCLKKGTRDRGDGPGAGGRGQGTGTGDKGQGTGDRGQGTGDRGQGTGERREERGDCFLSPSPEAGRSSEIPAPSPCCNHCDEFRDPCFVR
jgi:hypothetical protein